MKCNEDQLEMMAKYEVARMSDMDAYIGLRAPSNLTETSDVQEENMSLIM